MHKGIIFCIVLTSFIFFSHFTHISGAVARMEFQSPPLDAKARDAPVLPPSRRADDTMRQQPEANKRLQENLRYGAHKNTGPGNFFHYYDKEDNAEVWGVFTPKKEELPPPPVFINPEIIVPYPFHKPDPLH